MRDCPRHLASCILLVDDDIPFRRALAISLRLEGMAVAEASSRAEALRALGTQRIGLALVNQYLASDDGEGLLDEISRTSPATRLVVLSCRPGLSSALVSTGRAVQLVKPIETDQVLRLLAG